MDLHKSGNDKYREWYQENSVHICERIVNVRDLVLRLSSKCLVGETLEGELEQKPGDPMKCAHLFRTLVKIGVDRIDDVMECLGTSGNEHITKLFLDFKKSRLQLDDTDANPSPAKRVRIKVLPEKWWPERKELITSFVNRSTDDGELLVDYLRKKLLSSTGNVTAIVSKKHAIVGMGGIGKTSTAKWYANHFEDEYDHIIWIDSEGHSLTNSFTDLGKELGLDSDNYSPIDKLVKKILTELTSVRCLFVFDNAERFDGKNGLRLLLPTPPHHAIITSRNHDWGNPNEFGQIATFQLDVFTEEECVVLLSNALTPGGKLTERDEMIALGTELGYLPLALQCAVATILKSTRYTVSSYLERIQRDLKILVDKKILTEYERTVSATLRLSIEQIENDEEIDVECREWCKIILNVAAYCAPTDIPESLFYGLPNASQEMLSDAVDQLLMYSLVSSEGFGTIRTFGMHRLLQHVVRHKVLVDCKYAIQAIESAFQCMLPSLEVFYEHAVHSWNFASAQFDEVQRRWHEFPFAISQVELLEKRDSIVNFIKTTISNLKRVFQELDVPMIQLKLRLIDLMLQKGATEQARQVHSELQKMLEVCSNVEVPHKSEVLQHLRVIALDLMKNYSGKLEDESSYTDTEVLEAFEKLLDELSATRYDGKVANTQLYYGVQSLYKGVSLRWAVVLKYVWILEEVGQFDKAVDILNSEIFTSNAATGNPVDKNGIISVGRYLESNLQEVTLEAVVPDLFHLVKSTMEDTITRHDNEQIYTILEITRRYVKWLRKGHEPFTLYLEVLVFLIKRDWPAHLALEMLDEVSCLTVVSIRDCELNEEDVRALVDVLGSAWSALVTLTEKKGFVRGSWSVLIHLNLAYSSALLKEDKVSEIRELDGRTIALLTACEVDWTPRGKGMNVSRIMNLAALAGEACVKELLQSKLMLMRFMIDKSVAPAVKHNRWSVGSVMEMYDDACFILVSLFRLQEAAYLWDSGLQRFILGPSAVRPVEPNAVLRIGLQTLSLLEERRGSPEVNDTLSKFLVTLVECAQKALGDHALWYCDHKLKDLLPLIIRLTTHGHYSIASAFAEAATQSSVSSDESEEDEDEPFIRVERPNDRDDFSGLLALLPKLRSLNEVQNVVEKQIKADSVVRKLRSFLNDQASDSEGENSASDTDAEGEPRL